MMANARKCDVCGAFYEPGNPFDKEPNVRFNGIQLMWHGPFRTLWTAHKDDVWYEAGEAASEVPEHWDLCDGCQKKLLAFLCGAEQSDEEVENDTN